MSKYQMMFGVNLFSCFFTLWSLVNRGQFMPAVDFTMRHSDFFMHVVVLSITSATGQLFIFHTIQTYGPLVFTIIMTTRQVRVHLNNSRVHLFRLTPLLTLEFCGALGTDYEHFPLRRHFQPLVLVSRVVRRVCRCGSTTPPRLLEEQRVEEMRLSTVSKIFNASMGRHHHFLPAQNQSGNFLGEGIPSSS
jgi:hypothetical protein